MDAIEQLFRQKTDEATRILAAQATTAETSTKTDDIPFEVNKVLGKIKEETARRAKLSKRKPAVEKSAQNDAS